MLDFVTPRFFLLSFFLGFTDLGMSILRQGNVLNKELLGFHCTGILHAGSTLGLSYVGTGVELNDPSGSLPAQGIL